MNIMNMNQFIKQNEIGKGTALTANGALSYAGTGCELTDQFGKAGCFRGRNIEEVWADQARLWAESETAGIRFPFYLRMITRKDKIAEGEVTETVQKGQGQRDEAFKRLLWVAAYHSEEFYKNLWLLPIVGCWKDLITLSFMGEKYLTGGFELDMDKIYSLFFAGLSNKDQKDLVLKYLPRIRSEKKCTTPWAKYCNKFAKGFAAKNCMDYDMYRKMKSSGVAHKFQQDICGGLYADIEWSKIPGKALLSLVSGKFLSNHGLEKGYVEWLEKQPVVKFNGYPYELMGKLTDNFGRPTHNLATEVTVNKQFDNLIKTADEDNGAINGNVLCCLDTSGSMGCEVGNGATTAFNVCVSLGVYFSELNKGAFHNTVCMFDNVSTLKTLSGTFSEKINQIVSDTMAMGSTNFQSVIDLICNTRREHPEIPVEEFPKTLLVVSDMQFNPATKRSLWSWSLPNDEDYLTNYEAMQNKLRECFPSSFVDEMKVIWWQVNGEYGNDVPATEDMPNQYLYSGFDGAVISLLLGGDAAEEEKETGHTKTMEEAALDALNQEVLQLVQ